MKVKLYHNGDDVFIGWKTDFIPDCRGFALLRRRNGEQQEVSTWVGFANQRHKDGERRPSTEWPIQKYQWTDYMANPGDKLQYRVIPMVGAKDSLRQELDLASDWTEEITLSHECCPKVETFFNRGIVATQWVSRRLGIKDANFKKPAARLRQVINTPGDPFRNYLAGPLGERLFQILADARKNKQEIYAALYELDDQQLESELEKFGKRAHVVLANASAKKKGDDPNKPARERLDDKIDLHDRMCAPRALGHNKFLVICDGNKKPRWVWTGSQNWSKTGLCTQANNSVLIDDPDIGKEYVNQWTMLKEAEDQTPKDLKESNNHCRDIDIKATSLHLWFTPTIGKVDLNEARKIISKEAKEAILFTMFNPGPRESLLNEIIETARKGRTGKRLYIRGAINQDPSTAKNPVELFDSENSQKADFSVVLPGAIDKPTSWFVSEMKKLPGTWAMVHSKVVVIDPFSEHAVVMTGSHNLGPKASGTNDENLLIFRNAPGLGAAYATNIMSIYNQYRWRFRRYVQPEKKRWNGLEDTDTWQNGYLQKGSRALREINFWVGEQ